jgi:hypothetical protein
MLIDDRSQWLDSSGAVDGPRVMVNGYDSRERVLWFSAAQSFGELNPLLLVGDSGDFVIPEHAKSLTETGYDRVRAGNAELGQVVFGWIHDGVDVVAFVGGMFMVSADVAVADFVVLRR